MCAECLFIEKIISVENSVNRNSRRTKSEQVGCLKLRGCGDNTVQKQEPRPNYMNISCELTFNPHMLTLMYGTGSNAICSHARI